ncbi:LuxR family transcriptional regulator [Sphingobium aromaticiconvertens]|uniref:helix-turn-helix transcriptional regulator n=1 Tax=Sphingobium aromaticiconvertens TaxID=365341 RepID=UPI0030184C71
MGRYRRLDALAAALAEASDMHMLYEFLARIAREMGFDYFALAEHIDLRMPQNQPLQIHNYPRGWAAYYVDRDLGPRDPIRRASHRTHLGFAWLTIPRFLTLTPADRAVLAAGQAHGLGEGFTVPSHIPGEVSGSCTFVTRADEPLPRDQIWTAQLIGGLAFERGQRLLGRTTLSGDSAITERQRDCVLWAARGNTDGEIADILGISKETVIQHLKFARERYGVRKRTSLVIRALFDGLISFSEIFQRHRYW